MKTLFDRAAIGGMTLKNRLVMSPMGTASDPDGGFSAQSIAYYTQRAKGGFGLIILACNIATDQYETRPNNMLDSFHKVARLESLIEACHNYGSKVCVQISPGCGRMGYSDPNTPPYAASAVPSCWFPDLICRPFSTEQIHDLVKKVGYSAMLAKTAGADAVEFQGYGGYLIDQFMTSLWNRREDTYGGSLENRMRFPLELIDEVRRTCGKDFPILFKFTVSHELEGGRTPEEGVEIARILEKAGVSALQVCVGARECYYNPISSVYGEEGNKLAYTALVKHAVDIPVFCDGKLGDPAVARHALEEGMTDFIALGKQSLADPFWPEKVRQGREEDIRRCIYCCECHQGMHDGKLLTCSVNPQCGHEREYDLTPADTPKRVLVVGGGPGGMQCAVTAAERGHHVTLWEARQKLGGNLLAAAAPDFKKDVGAYLNYLTRQVARAGVTVSTGHCASAEDILAWGADAVVLAPGSTPVVPKVPGIGGRQVSTAYDVLLGIKDTGERVAVIGGGLVGCETALMLAGRGKQVAIVEMMDTLLPRETLNPNNEQLLMKKIKASAIDVRTGTKVCAVQIGSVLVEKDGAADELPCDSVVLAVGSRSASALEDQLWGQVEVLRAVGDCVSPRKVYTAVHEGFQAGRLL